MPHHVAITGIGVFSPVGPYPGPFWERLLAGASGTRALDRPEVADYPCRVAGLVDGFDPLAWVGERDLPLLDRTSQLAVAAAIAARRDAGLEGGADLAPAAAVVGSAFGCIETTSEGMFAFKERGLRAAKTWMIPRGMANAPAAAISLHLGARGPHWVVASACASGTMAIGHAARLVRSGAVPLAIAGGADAPVVPSILAAWCALRVVTRRNDDPAGACRPFSADRDGLVISEGAAMLVLEDLERARARGARIYAEVSGYGESSDASHITAPSVDGETRAIRGALADAGLGPDDVDWVSAHGTATQMNDRCETEALKEALGERARRIPISAAKSMVGHAMGASGAIEAAAAALGIREGRVHPTANLSAPDPACDLDYVPEGARRVAVRHALKQSFAFGGANAVLVLSRSDTP